MIVGRKSLKCEFESHPEHQNLEELKNDLLGRNPDPIRVKNVYSKWHKTLNPNDYVYFLLLVSIFGMPVDWILFLKRN